MNPPDLSFLSLIIALTIYIGFVRHRVRDARKEATDDAKKSHYKWVAIGLTLIDAPLVLAGLAILIHCFWPTFWPGTEPSLRIFPAAVYLFAFAVAVMAIHHGAAWWKSIAG